MMNKLTNIRLKGTAVTLSALFAMGLVSCNKWLDKNPDDRTTLDNVETINELLTSGYPKRSNILMYEVRSDNAADKGIRAWANPTTDREIYTFQEYISSTYQDTPTGYWNNMYECISVANQALKGLEELKGLTADQARKVAESKGEALMIRAYSIYMLAQTFCRPYDPSTADQYLGVPCPTEPEDVVLKGYKRGTLKETYDRILKDFEEGYALIGNSYAQPKYHWTKTSAAALGTRIYRTVGQWDKVVELGNFVLGTEPGIMLRDMTKYRNLSYNEQKKLYTMPTENTNLILNVAMSWWVGSVADSRYGLTPSIRTRAGFGDHYNFLRVEITPNGPYFGGTLYANFPKWWEYFRVDNIQAGTGRGFIAVPLVTAEEVLFNMGEAYAMTGEYPKAVDALQLFVTKFFKGYSAADDRYTVTNDKIVSFYQTDQRVFKPFYPLDETQTAYVKAFTDMRRVAFFQEGLRWLDIRHYNLPVEHNLLSHRDAKSSSVSLEAGDPRYAFQIPSSTKGYNLEPNPGYEKSDKSLMSSENQ